MGATQVGAAEVELGEAVVEGMGEAVVEWVGAAMHESPSGSKEPEENEEGHDERIIKKKKRE